MKTSTITKAASIASIAGTLYSGSKIFSNATLPPVPLDVIAQSSATPTPPSKTTAVVRHVVALGIGGCIFFLGCREEKNSSKIIGI